MDARVNKIEPILKGAESHGEARPASKDLPGTGLHIEY